MSMLSSHRFDVAVSVILRVPSLFVLNVWCNVDPGKQADDTSKHHRLNVSNIKWIFNIMYYAVIIACLTVSFIPLKKLINLYTHILSGILLGLCRYLCSTNGLKAISIHRFALMVYTFPSIVKILYFHKDAILFAFHVSDIFMVLFVVFFFLKKFSHIVNVVMEGLNFAKICVENIGVVQFLVSLWQQYNMAWQFFIFWLGLFVIQLYWKISLLYHVRAFHLWMFLVLSSIGNACTSQISVIGLCSTVSFVSYFVLCLAKIYLEGWKKYKDNLSELGGVTEGITVFFLCFQIDITNHKEADKAVLMAVVIFIMVSTLVESIYQITDPVVLILAASQNKRFFKHMRAMLLSMFLVIFPLFMTYMICQIFNFDLWLLVILSSCLLTTLQAFGMVVIYFLFIYDSHRVEPWAKLDDAVYYTRACIHTIEFIIAVLVVGYGLKQTLFGDWSYVNLIILCIHFYQNIYRRAMDGWRSFLLRKEAVYKIQSLKMATQAELEAYNDVCSICYQDMTSARILQCGHYFHEICLKKWLYIQDKCPLCHSNISTKKQGSSSMATEEPEVLEPMNEDADNDNGIVDIDSCESSTQQQDSQTSSTATEDPEPTQQELENDVAGEEYVNVDSNEEFEAK